MTYTIVDGWPPWLLRCTTYTIVNGGHTLETSQKGHEIEFKVDGDSLETTSQELTARQILELAGLDPSQHYLVLVKGGKPDTSYETKPDEEIHLHPGIEFASVFTGPTHVS
jgi:hypothetical protein